MESEFITIRCRTCGGVAHPATGCVYSENFIVCGPCTREAWVWIRGFTNQKGRRRGPSFYGCVNRISPPIVVESVPGSSPEG